VAERLRPLGPARRGAHDPCPASGRYRMAAPRGRQAELPPGAPDRRQRPVARRRPRCAVGRARDDRAGAPDPPEAAQAVRFLPRAAAQGPGRGRDGPAPGSRPAPALPARVRHVPGRAWLPGPGVAAGTASDQQERGPGVGLPPRSVGTVRPRRRDHPHAHVHAQQRAAGRRDAPADQERAPEQVADAGREPEDAAPKHGDTLGHRPGTRARARGAGRRWAQHDGDLGRGVQEAGRDRGSGRGRRPVRRFCRQRRPAQAGIAAPRVAHEPGGHAALFRGRATGRAVLPLPRAQLPADTVRSRHAALGRAPRSAPVRRPGRRAHGGPALHGNRCAVGKRGRAGRGDSRRAVRLRGRDCAEQVLMASPSSTAALACSSAVGTILEHLFQLFLKSFAVPRIGMKHPAKHGDRNDRKCQDAEHVVPTCGRGVPVYRNAPVTQGRQSAYACNTGRA